jgi:hypothetical protein
MSDHVLYQIDVVNCRKRKTFSKWTGQWIEWNGMEARHKRNVSPCRHVI